ncbi:MAG: hypothetical protein J3R72DRAFT_431416 [Linnemannia gamsii]|nr:MAG: hypothetical protein J3R72DRAFT_431416 [Linnemannia gamsii]
MAPLKDKQLQREIERTRRDKKNHSLFILKKSERYSNGRAMLLSSCLSFLFSSFSVQIARMFPYSIVSCILGQGVSVFFVCVFVHCHNRVPFFLSHSSSSFASLPVPRLSLHTFDL